MTEEMDKQPDSQMSEISDDIAKAVARSQRRVRIRVERCRREALECLVHYLASCDNCDDVCTWLEERAKMGGSDFRKWCRELVHRLREGGLPKPEPDSE